MGKKRHELLDYLARATRQFSRSSCTYTWSPGKLELVALFVCLQSRLSRITHMEEPARDAVRGSTLSQGAILYTARSILGNHRDDTSKPPVNGGDTDHVKP